jgi:8-oxo-dGTP diphosphatase
LLFSVCKYKITLRAEEVFTNLYTICKRFVNAEKYRRFCGGDRMYMKNTTLCYLERDGKYLMLHRVKKENDINRDKWIGVGGKAEENESPDECALREVFEETGYVMESWRCRGVVTFVSDGDSEYMYVFTCDRFSGTEKVCDEGDLEWVDRGGVTKLTIWEGDRIFLRLLRENAPFFLLKLVYSGDSLVSAVLDGKKIK